MSILADEERNAAFALHRNISRQVVPALRTKVRRYSATPSRPFALAAPMCLQGPAFLRLHHRTSISCRWQCQARCMSRSRRTPCAVLCGRTLKPHGHLPSRTREDVAFLARRAAAQSVWQHHCTPSVTAPCSRAARPRSTAVRYARMRGAKCGRP